MNVWSRLAVAVLVGLVVGAGLAVWSGQQRHLTRLDRQVGLLERQVEALNIARIPQ